MEIFVAQDSPEQKSVAERIRQAMAIDMIDKSLGPLVIRPVSADFWRNPAPEHELPLLRMADRILNGPRLLEACETGELPTLLAKSA